MRNRIEDKIVDDIIYNDDLMTTMDLAMQKAARSFGPREKFYLGDQADVIEDEYWDYLSDLEDEYAAVAPLDEIEQADWHEIAYRVVEELLAQLSSESWD